MLRGNTQDEERLNDTILLDVPIAILSHIQVGGIGATLAALDGKGR